MIVTASKLSLLLALALKCLGLPRDSPLSVNIDWQTVLIKSKTTATLQSVAMPSLLAESNNTIRENALAALYSVKADYVRYVPWFPYPLMGVPEIEPPVINASGCKTTWDFTYADQLLLDFLQNTPGVSHIINFSTTPGWMWMTNEPYTYPQNVSLEDWGYNAGTQLRDPSGNELAEYYKRLLSWYVQGGFTDECGVYHYSGHNLQIEFWEVLNEVRAEHAIPVETYNQLYDAITAAIHEISPQTQFVGYSYDQRDPVYLEGFLAAGNHKPGTPLDWISYHFYASGQGSGEDEAAAAFKSADDFFKEVMAMEEVRKRVSPHTKTTINEVGTFSNSITDEYWAWSGGVYAYILSHLAVLGIDAVGESQLFAIPSNNPSVSMVEWTTGMPNARLRVLQLLQSRFKIGDDLLNTTLANSQDESRFFAQALRSGDGVRKVLLVNKQNKSQQISLPGLQSGRTETVDVESAGDGLRTGSFSGGVVNLSPYAVIVAIAS